jgi:hypothetical protein
VGLRSAQLELVPITDDAAGFILGVRVGFALARRNDAKKKAT